MKKIREKHLRQLDAFLIVLETAGFTASALNAYAIAKGLKEEAEETQEDMRILKEEGEWTEDDQLQENLEADLDEPRDFVRDFYDDISKMRAAIAKMEKRLSEGNKQ